ncbi:MAG: PAS domain-containing sensor histidine kinase [Polyangiaceae bacterium]|nr:PAS domain-containing sensor histidine kinase [Polyangiaceae bacterium]
MSPREEANSSPQLLTDRLGIIYSANEEARRLLGRDLVGKQIFRYVERDWVDTVRSTLSSFDGKGTARLEVRMSSGRPPSWSMRLRLCRAESPHRLQWIIEPVGAETGVFPTVKANAALEARPPRVVPSSDIPANAPPGGLRLVLAWTNLLRHVDLSDVDRATTIGRIEEHILQQAAEIESLWHAARLELGAVEVQCRNLSLSDLVRVCVEGMQPAAQATGTTMTLHIDQSPIVCADELRLAQVVTHLLSNAIRFTPAGGEIDIYVGVLEDTALLRVCDTGVGMTKDHVARVFDSPWNNTEPSTSGASSAFGLFLVRRIVELHKGSVRAFSPGPGHGSIFTVRLPYVSA